jgi:hypothetical protein
VLTFIVSVGAQMYHTGMLVLGTITLGGVTFWALRSEGVSVTVKMFRTFKKLLGNRQQIYWLIIGCMSSYWICFWMIMTDLQGQFSKPPWSYGVH